MSFSKISTQYIYDKLPYWSIEIDRYELSSGKILYDATVYCDRNIQESEDFSSEDEALKWAQEWIINYTNQD